MSFYFKESSGIASVSVMTPTALIMDTMGKEGFHLELGGIV